VASGVKFRQIGNMDMKAMLDENFLWASVVWGGVAGGYLIYGWRQKSGIPLAAGAAMTMMTFIGPNALIMSLASIAIMVANWWLMKRE